jgi:spore maturation protein SpmA
MEAVSQRALEGAKEAITLVIGLTGGMILFLGLVKVASEGGLLRAFIRLLRPVLRRFFPEVPAEHPAMHAMIMNLAANMLGLGNAATPFGLKAMVELDRLNPHRGSATNAMALFLAINATSITLMPPTGTVMIRAAANSTAPFAIWIPTLIATIASTLTAVLVCLAVQRLPFFRPRPTCRTPRCLDSPRPRRPDRGASRSSWGSPSRSAGASPGSGPSTRPRRAAGPSCATWCCGTGCCPCSCSASSRSGSWAGCACTTCSSKAARRA